MLPSLWVAWEIFREINIKSNANASLHSIPQNIKSPEGPAWDWEEFHWTRFRGGTFPFHSQMLEVEREQPKT